MSLASVALSTMAGPLNCTSPVLVTPVGTTLYTAPAQFVPAWPVPVTPRVNTPGSGVGQGSAAPPGSEPQDGVRVRAPEGIDATELVSLLRERHGVQLANGQAHLKGQIFRIGHIGYYDVFDIATALGAVELGLADLGADIERGAAVTKALDVYAEGARV